MHQTAILLSWGELDRSAKVFRHVHSETVDCIARPYDVASSVFDGVEVGIDTPLIKLARKNGDLKGVLYRC